MAKKKKVESVGYGGFVLTFEPERTQWLAEQLCPDLELSESFSALDWEFDHRELVFLVLQSSPVAISAFALMERMHGSGGSGKPKMRMSTPMVVFDEPVTMRELGDADPKDVISTSSSMKRLAPAVWEALVDSVRKSRPLQAKNIDGIVAQRTAPRNLAETSKRFERLSEQRDGLGLALDIGGLDRSPVLKSMQVDNASEARSILDLLDAAAIQERSLLEHDRNIFESLLGEQSARVATFSEGENRSVRVLVVDKDELETVLGIDLIIYQMRYNSFLLIQYKRMKDGARGWSHSVNPSSNLYKQLLRMQQFEAVDRDDEKRRESSLWSYRLNEGAFYFKFCEQTRPSARDDSLIAGITMSSEHLREFLELPNTKGEKGGGSVGYYNCPRYLNNTEFVMLARSGWIGTGPRSTALMKEILDANQAGGRAAMLAIIEIPEDRTAAGRRRK